MGPSAKRKMPTWLAVWTASLSPFFLLIATQWMGLELWGVHGDATDPSGRRFVAAFCATTVIGLVGTLAAVVAAIRIRFPYRLLFWLIALVDLFVSVFLLVTVGVEIVHRMLG